jgi:photosystem II PsbZ protein|tara:strand:+ start:20277 stop:20477 length:201 start_codon:yes stop_codon:yes gene_type:complete
MAVIIQLITFLLVIFSLALVVGVPVVLATPGQWETSKNSIYQYILIWGFLVFATALATTTATWFRF